MLTDDTAVIAAKVGVSATFGRLWQRTASFVGNIAIATIAAARQDRGPIDRTGGQVMDLSPLAHAMIAVCLQVTVGILSGNWWLGGLLGYMWFIAREHTQAEYRWITMFGHGKRANMPWWGGLDWRVWDMASVLDWLVPVLTCIAVYWVAKYTC